MVVLKVLSSDEEEDEEDDDDTFTLSDDSDEEAFPVKKEPKPENSDEAQTVQESEGISCYQNEILLETVLHYPIYTGMFTPRSTWLCHLPTLPQNSCMSVHLGQPLARACCKTQVMTFTKADRD